jgi:hypothetical protein
MRPGASVVRPAATHCPERRAGSAMTWTKLGDEFSDDMANRGVSSDAYRTHVEAIQWLYRVEQFDCHVPKAMVRRFAASEDHEQAVKELVNRGLWTDGGDHYVVRHHGEVVRQSLNAQRAKVERDRRAQQAKRDRDKASALTSATSSLATQPDRQPAPRDEHLSSDDDWLEGEK